jgi:hypothetical protein
MRIMAFPAIDHRRVDIDVGLFECVSFQVMAGAAQGLQGF